MKLHLGCGKRYMPGFVHIDMNHLPHIDYVCNVKDLSFLKDNSIEYIYASHVLSYFNKLDSIEALHEWHRVLKPSGLLRLAVPNFEALAIAYLEKKMTMKFISGVLYGYMDVAGGINHKSCYDFHMLKDILSIRGFMNIRNWDWREVKDIPEDDWARSYVPHMDFENGTLISLNVEAVKV